MQCNDRRAERGQKLQMDNFVSFPDSCDDPQTSGIIYCGTVRQNHKGIPNSFDSKILKLKHTDIQATVSGNLTAMILEDKQDMHILTNMQRPSAGGNFCEEHGEDKNLSLLNTTISTCSI